ncbi:MAG: DUF1499 domain-containing protein [Sinimarinibacterium sp.]
MLKLSGRRPRDLGIERGRFRAARSWKPNWVSSQVDGGDAHYIAPFPIAGDANAAWARLRSALAATPRITIIEERPDYLYAEASTPTLGFVDDLEFALTSNAIHVRSSSRLGIRDFDVNRKRIEALRSAVKGA